MPMAAAMMPPSAIGVSSTRCSPYLRCSPSVQRNTPPKKPTSWPSSTTAGSLPHGDVHGGIQRLDHVHLRHGVNSSQLPQFGAQQLAFAAQVFGQFLEHVLEHQIAIEARTLGHRAVAHRFLPRGRDLRIEFLAERAVARLRPLAERDQVLLEPLDRIAERPALRLVLWPVARRIVAGGMRCRAIGHQFDQRAATAGARAIRGPARRRVDGEEIIAVDAQARACRRPGRAPRRSSARRRPCPGRSKSPTGC